MRVFITFFILLFVISCSNIKYIERKANKGDITFCFYAVQHYKEVSLYTTDKKAQEKIVKYCKKGLSVKVDTTAYNPSYDYAVFNRELGKSIFTKPSEKYFYYRKAAEYGDGEAQFVMGIYYLDGKGGQINNDSALYWFKKSSDESGDIFSALAQAQLGDIFMEGKLVKADTLTALYYYKKSCACNEKYSRLEACQKVIQYYNRQVYLKDTTELAIYKELARKLSRHNGVR